MLDIEAIDHLVLRTARLDSMLAFYTKVLGCTLEKTQAGIGLYQLRAGSGLIDLLVRDDAPPAENSRLEHFCLRLKHFDAEQLRDHLANHGVACGAVENRYGARGNGPSVYIEDPDGNTIELKAPPAAG